MHLHLDCWRGIEHPISTLLQKELYCDSAGELRICKNFTFLQQSVDIY